MRKGRTLSPADLLIAALVRYHRGVLVTRDRDFSDVPGLAVELCQAGLSCLSSRPIWLDGVRGADPPEAFGDIDHYGQGGHRLRLMGKVDSPFARGSG